MDNYKPVVKEYRPEVGEVIDIKLGDENFEVRVVSIASEDSLFAAERTDGVALSNPLFDICHITGTRNESKRLSLWDLMCRRASRELLDTLDDIPPSPEFEKIVKSIESRVRPYEPGEVEI